MAKQTIRLSDTQRAILVKAAGREDGAASIPAGMNKATATKAGAGLVARKLARETRASADMPVWRKDAEGRALSLVITRAGRAAIGVAEEAGVEKRGPAATRRARASSKPARPAAGDSTSATTTRTVERAASRAGSKHARLVAMLAAADGATLDALASSLGWLPHTTRAAMSGLRKRGMAIERLRGADGRSLYRIARATNAAGAA